MLDIMIGNSRLVKYNAILVQTVEEFIHEKTFKGKCFQKYL